MNTVFYKPLSKINDHTQFQASKPQIGQSLRFEDWVICQNRLAFYNDQPSGKQIQLYRCSDYFSFIFDRYRFFGFNYDPATLDFER